MLRTAERRAPSPADDLLDRTGIIAASLPQSRRSPEDTPPIPVFLPIAGDGVSAAVFAPRPRVARRRAAFAGLSAAGLLALGWLAGGLFSGLTGSTGDVAAPAAPQPVVAPAPAPSPAPAPPAAPVTVYVPVPDEQPPAVHHETSRPTTSRSSAPDHEVTPPSARDEPRSDDPGADSTSSRTAAKSAAAEEIDQYLAPWKRWIDLANRMSRH